MGQVVSIDAFRRVKEAEQAVAADAQASRLFREKGLGEHSESSVTQFTPANPPSELKTESSMGLVPIELGTGIDDRREALDKIEEYQLRAIDVRMISDQPSAGLLYLMSIKDAITLNMKMLELEDLSSEEIGSRIDLIQLLENTDPALVDSLWESFTRGIQTSSQSDQSEQV